MTPVHRGAQRLLPRQGRAGCPPVSRRKRSSSRAASCSDRQRPHARRRQLQRQRDARPDAGTSAATRRVAPREREGRAARAGPLDEESYAASDSAERCSPSAPAGGVVRGHRRARAPARSSRRRHPSASRLVARTSSSGQRAEQPVGQGRAGADQVLAVVEDQQHLLRRAAPRPACRAAAAPGAPARRGARRPPAGTSAGSASGASSTSQTPSA